VSRRRSAPDGSGGPNRSRRAPDWLVAMVLAEAVALAIALITPITPTRTGSTWSAAELFSANPGYLEKVAANFVMVNGIMGVLALVVWILWSRSSSKSGQNGPG
jgi:hypothetical protein